MGNSYTTRLKKRLPLAGDENWDDEWHDNEKIDDVVASALLSAGRVLSGGLVTVGSGLTVDYEAVDVLVEGGVYAIAGGSLTMTAGPPGGERGNWIYIDASGAVVAAITPPGGSFVPLAKVDTDETTVLRIADLRPMAPVIRFAAAKTTPVDDDELAVADSEAGYAMRRFTWESLKATLRTWLDSMYFFRANILGTVSQSGGVPTGAIFESGSNANGEYVRYADGTQICTNEVTFPDITTQHGSIYRSSSYVTWNFPAVFAGDFPVVTGNDTTSTFNWVTGIAASFTATNLRMHSGTSVAGPRYVKVCAIGRWF